jgi:hypothetical protein
MGLIGFIGFIGLIGRTMSGRVQHPGDPVALC